MTSAQYDIEKTAVQVEVVQEPPTTKTIRLPPHSKIGDASPLGLFSFALTTFILSMYNVQARGITTPNVIVGMSIGSGGLVQLLAGMWEYPRGNTFAATAFSSYGSFWISYAIILIPSFGIVDAYGKNLQEFNNAIGIYLIAWFIVTFFYFIASLRKNVCFIALTFSLFTTLILLAAGAFLDNASLNKAGGAIGIIVALIGFYTGLATLLAGEESPIFRLPLGVIYKRID